VFLEYADEIQYLVITDCDVIISLTQSVKSDIPMLERWNENISLPVSSKRCGTLSAQRERGLLRPLPLGEGLIVTHNFLRDE